MKKKITPESRKRAENGEKIIDYGEYTMQIKIEKNSEIPSKQLTDIALMSIATGLNTANKIAMLTRYQIPSETREKEWHKIYNEIQANSKLLNSIYGAM